MNQKHTLDELNNLSREELITIVLMMQGQLDTLNDNIEKLIEQVRLANSYRFGKHSEKLSVIEGQMSFFDEADAMYDNSAAEPEADEVISVRKKKTRGQRELDLKEFPVDVIPAHSVSEEELDAFFGKGNWRKMPDETYKRLRHEPESWTVELHTVEVYVGTDGDHQDEFLRGKRPKDLLRNSIVTPSLLAYKRLGLVYCFRHIGRNLFAHHLMATGNRRSLCSLHDFIRIPDYRILPHHVVI